MEDEAVPVDKAVSLFFPHGGLKADTLMRAIRSGKLSAERLGRRYFVTRKAVNEWRAQCHVAPKDSGSTSERGRGVLPSTSSSMASEKLQQDAALAICEALSKGLPLTQPRRSGQTGNNVISLKYQSGT